ncbi:hypothetical protein AB0H43_14130 [Hamadaea sp. NPDC050747]|uniref:hypothetical protein n=1 Tax=Hamadaea sp. NPDC050747 TaxID=3155789 RepID=UPI0033E0EF3E
MNAPNDRLKAARLSRLSPTGSGRTLSRQELADAVNAELVRRGVRHAAIDAGHIGKFERGVYRWPQQVYREALRCVFGVDNDADLGFFIVRGRGNPADTPLTMLSAFPSATAAAVPDGSHLDIMITAGSTLGSAEIRIDLQPQQRPSRLAMHVFSTATSPLTGKTLIAERRDDQHLPGAIQIPDAYAIDDLTTALIWLYARLDQDLLPDDRALDESWNAIDASLDQGAHAVAAAAMPSLSSVSKMWLGSRVCAAFIETSLRRGITDRPMFWTREQRGEEAATWLSFTHKQQYLHRTARTGVTRTFCLPAQQISESPLTDRILLLLTIAYMEASGVRCRILADATYSDVDGFVLAGNRAIKANWIRTDALWQVADHTGARSTAPYAQVIAAADHDTFVGHPAPAQRLRALADYLDLDWRWLQHRCRELAAAGLHGLIRPHSRHLSLHGTQTAINFIATLTQDRD